jgi:hypothetical protein
MRDDAQASLPKGDTCAPQRFRGAEHPTGESHREPAKQSRIECSDHYQNQRMMVPVAEPDYPATPSWRGHAIYKAGPLKLRGVHHRHHRFAASGPRGDRKIATQ